MTDIELLPLPEADDSVENHAQWPIVIDSDVWLQKSVQDYARACVVHAASAKDAEIEALRAEVERLQSINSGLCRKSNYYLIDSARWQERAERLAEALRECRAELLREAKAHEIKADRPHQSGSDSQWHAGMSEAYEDAADKIAALHAEREEAAAALEATREDAWQPIETAPKDGSDILILFDCATVPVVHIAWFRSQDEWQQSGQFAASEDETIDDYVGWWSYTRNSVTQERLVGWSAPTHWMPLPAPPKEARNG